MNKLKQEKLWTKDFILVTAVNFVMTLSMYLLLVTIAAYATDTYDVPPSTAGLVASIFIIGALAARLYAGKQIEIMGSKKMLILGVVISVVVTTLYFIPANIYFLIVVRFLHGIGLGLATTATGTIVAQIIPRKRSGEGISYFSLSIVLTTAIGPLIGILLINHIGYTSLFVFSLVIGIICLITSLPLKAPVVEGEPDTDHKGFSLSNYFELRAVPIAFVMFIAALAYSSILSFITSYSSELNLVEAGSFYFLVYAIIISVSRPFTGRLMDARGANSVAYPTLVIFAIGLLILSQVNSSFLLLLAAAVLGLGYGNFQSTAQALAIKVTPRHRLGLANSTYFIFLDLGLGLGPFVLGYLVPYVGFSGLYLSLVPLVIVAIFVYYLLCGRKGKELDKVPTLRYAEK